MIRSPSDEYLRLLEAHAPSVVELALTVRAMVLEEAPEADEQLYDATNAVAVYYSFTEKPTDAFIHIATFPTWINLGFNRGSELNDPGCILRGEGLWIRFIRLSSLADAEKVFVRNFVIEAVSKARRPPPEEKEVQKEPEVRVLTPRLRRRRTT